MDILTRAQWGARLGLFAAMRLPAQGLHVHHSVTIVDDDRNYHATGDVAADMREIENIGQQRFGRFPYSWCIHPSGWIGEGAGFTIGAHTANFNSTSFGICFIGNYDTRTLSAAQVAAFRELRAWLVATGRLAANHYVQPHRARKATACPGANTIARWGDLLASTSLPEDDDMTPEQDLLLQRIAYAVIPFYQSLKPADGRFQVQTLVRQAIDVDSLAAAIAARLPAGSVPVAAIADAVAAELAARLAS